MVDAQQAFKDFLGQRLLPALKQRGFSGRGSTFHLERSGSWGLVGVQKSQESRKDRVRFTVNLGVTSGRLQRFAARASHGSRPTVEDCHWQERLGFLLPDPQDRWWTIDPAHTVEALAPELVAQVLEVGVPEVEKYLSDEALRDLWLSGRSPGLTELERLQNLAALLSAIGPRDALPRVLSDLRTISPAAAMLLERKLAASREPPPPA